MGGCYDLDGRLMKTTWDGLVQAWKAPAIDAAATCNYEYSAKGYLFVFLKVDRSRSAFLDDYGLRDGE